MSISALQLTSGGLVVARLRARHHPIGPLAAERERCGIGTSRGIRSARAAIGQKPAFGSHRGPTRSP